MQLFHLPFSKLEISELRKAIWEYKYYEQEYKILPFCISYVDAMCIDALPSLEFTQSHFFSIRLSKIYVHLN